MSSEEDIVSSAAEGATKGALEYGEDKIKDMVAKFRNRELAFVEDRDTIKEVKNQRQKAEWQLFASYIDDKELRVQFQMGMLLRNKEKKDEDLDAVRGKIRSKYGSEGVHRASFVQNGLFSKCHASLLEKMESEGELEHELKDLFENIEQRVEFIENDDDSDKKAKQVNIQINANTPDIYVLSSAGSARQICESVKEKVKDQIPDEYVIENYEEYYGDKKRIYIIRKEDI